MAEIVDSLPVIRPLPEAAPRARSGQQVHGTGWRITVLSDGVFRVERSADGGFEDRASTFAIRRDLPPADFTVERVGEGVVLTTRCPRSSAAAGRATRGSPPARGPSGPHPGR